MQCGEAARVDDSLLISRRLAGHVEQQPAEQQERSSGSRKARFNKGTPAALSGAIHMVSLPIGVTPEARASPYRCAAAV